MIPEGIDVRRWEDLYPYQKEGVRWLSDHTVGILGDQMGLGKTIQCLIAHPLGRGLNIVCPASIKNVWAKEAAAWRDDLDVSILSGRGSWRWAEPDEIVITNYEILPSASECKLPPAGISLVADEAHYTKSPRSQRTRKFRLLSRLVEEKAGRVWLATGTPLLNRPDELWSILAGIRSNKKVFESWRNFAKLFGWFDGAWGQVDPRVPEMLRTIMLARRRHEVLPDLPVKTYREIELTFLPLAVRKACDDVAAEMREAGVDPLKIDVDDPDALAAFEEATFASHLSTARKLLASAKIDLAEEIASQYEEEEEPLIVFSAHRDPVEALGERDGWAKIYGDTPIAKRGQIVEDFQEGKLKGLALTIPAGGLGLTLTRAATAIFCDLCWSPSVNAQAEDRLCRVGQTRGVQIVRLIANHTIDQSVMRLLARKQVLIDATIDAATTPPGGNGIWKRRTDKHREGRSIRFVRNQTRRKRRRAHA